MRNLIKMAAVNNVGYSFFIVFILCAWSITSKGQSLDSFKLVLCNETIKHNFFKDVYMIDSITKDTIKATSLLDGKEILLSKKNTYNVVLVGRKKWNYLFQLKSTWHSCNYCNYYTVCYNSKAVLTRKHRQSDMSLHDGKTDIGFWSEIVSKSGKKARGKYGKFGSVYSVKTK